MNDTIQNLEPEDVDQVKNVFQRAIDAIISQSNLEKKVENLANEVASLTREMQRLRNLNDMLDNQVTNFRQRAEAAEASAKDANELANSLSAEGANLRAQAERNSADINLLHGEAAELRKERDDAEMRVMELTDELERLKAKQRRLLDAARDLEEPKVVPIASPTQEPNPEGDTPDWVRNQSGQFAR